MKVDPYLGLTAWAFLYLGSRVAREAKEKRYRVRVLIRKPEQIERLGFTPDEVRIAQATRPESLKGLCDGVDVVFSSLGITRQKDGLTYEQVDYQAKLFRMMQVLNWQRIDRKIKKQVYSVCTFSKRALSM